MRRGEIYWVDFEPVKGAEASKARPAVIISQNAANNATTSLGYGLITVVPVTSNVNKILSFQVLLRSFDSGLAHDSKIQAEQLRGVALTRFGEYIGTVPNSTMSKLDDALRLHLEL